MASPEAAARWGALLDALESDAARAVSGAPLAPWIPPADMPELPDELRARAEAVLAAQSAANDALVTARADLGRRIAALRNVPSTQPERTPVYVDRMG